MSDVQINKYEALVLANAMSDALSEGDKVKIKRALREMPTSGWMEARQRAGRAMMILAFPRRDGDKA